MKGTIERITLILMVAGALARSVSAQLLATDAITARDIQGGGGWQTDGKAAVANQQWSLNVTRGDDNSLTGRVTLTGSPLASAGNVSGHIIGTTVSGTITDDDGSQIATFQVRVPVKFSLSVPVRFSLSEGEENLGFFYF